MSDSHQDSPRVLFPPPVIYFLFLFAGWGLGRLWVEPGLGLAVDVRRILAVVLVLIGLGLDGMAAGQLRRMRTAIEPWKPSSDLATGGLFGVSRNPIYLGFSIAYLGLAVAMDSLWAVVCILPCLVVIDRFVITREEAYLSRRFGAAYDAYRRMTRRWL